MSPLELNNLRQEELAARQNAQTNTEVQQVDPSIVLDNTPEGLKPKGSAKLGQKILNLGKKGVPQVMDAFLKIEENITNIKKTSIKMLEDLLVK